MTNQLILDDFFKELFNNYFNKTISEETLKEIDEFILTFDSTLIIDMANILKVAKDMGYSFTEVYNEIKNTLVDRIPEDKSAFDRFIVSLTLKYLIVSKSTGINGFVRERRDFVAEVAAQKFQLPIEMVTAVEKSALLNDPTDVYSITDPPLTNWDEYFFNVCRQTARHSKCFSRRIGAVLVRDKSIISTGYNGPPRGVPSCERRWALDPHFIAKYESQMVKSIDPDNPICPRYTLGAKSGELLDICIAGHAEENAILNAARMGVCTKDATLYMTCFTGDTEVVTETGLRPIKDICIGDRVLSKNGKFNKVYDTHKRNYSGDVLTIKPKGLELFDFKVTPTHKVFGKKAGTCCRKGNESRSCFLCYDENCKDNVSNIGPDELFANDLTNEDYLFVPTLLENISFANDTRRGDTNKRTTLKEIPDTFFEDDEYPWIVGLYTAEGSINKVNNGSYPSTAVFTLHKKETYYSKRVVSFFEKYGFNVTVKDTNNTKRVWVHSNQVASHLSNICGEGAKNKIIDKGLLFSDKVLKVIEGLYCGDGTCVKEQKSITTVSRNLAKQISLVLLLNGFNVRVYEEDEKIDKNKVKHCKAYRIFYSDNDKNQVNRKSNFIKISSINKTNSSEIDVFDLSVKNDASYSVGPFAVHNCGIPCFRCLIKIINAGISEIVVTGVTFYDDNSEFLLNNSNVKVRLYNFK